MILAPKTDQYFMQEALKEARKAFDLDEVPVGTMYLRGSNCYPGTISPEHLNDVTAHAEMQAFTAARC